jgi:hypothetical protein
VRKYKITTGLPVILKNDILILGTQRGGQVNSLLLSYYSASKSFINRQVVVEVTRIYYFMLDIESCPENTALN